MTLSVTAGGVSAVALAYLIGSIPSAYVLTRLFKGKDIRQLGTGHTGRGNVGARNVYVNVGKAAGVLVAVLDIIKGAGAVFVAEWLLGWPSPSATTLDARLIFVLAAGLAAVVGHIWPVYIGFKGGEGLATAIGVVAVLLKTSDLVLSVFIIVILLFTTRNAILSVSLGLLTVPAYEAYFRRPWWMTVFPLVIAAVMFVHFLPNILAEWRKAGSMEKLVSGLVRRDTPRDRR
jgi:acyl phosphate:glycerol-3-phosphate acyltransferase